MSAECWKCGSDIVYPVGTWPIGECPSCSRDERICELEAALVRIRDWDGFRHTGEVRDCAARALEHGAKRQGAERPPKKVVAVSECEPETWLREGKA